LLDSSRTKLIVFGDNKYNQLGVDSELIVYEPKIIPVVQAVKSLTCGWTHTVLLNVNSELWTMGRNNYGQLGRYNQTKTMLL
jgi:alpha-tubulin suppressor-like RCC1 family protein